MGRSLLALAILAMVTVIVLWVSRAARRAVLSAALRAEARLAGLQEKQTEIDGHRIVYLERGSSTPDADVLLLLHGFSADKTLWTRFIKALDRDVRVIAIDWPAHGDSSYHPGADYRLATQADRLAEFIDRLGIERAHLAGSSMGGAIAADFASRYGPRVITLSLMNAGGANNSRTQSEFERGLAAGDNLLLARRPADYPAVLARITEKPPFVPWPLSTALAEIAAERQPRFQAVFEQIEDRLMTADTAYLAQIQAPTLILWGNKDRILDVANAELFEAGVPNHELVIYENIGHLPMLEASRRTAAEVERFIAAHRRKGPEAATSRAGLHGPTGDEVT